MGIGGHIFSSNKRVEEQEKSKKNYGNTNKEEIEVEIGLLFEFLITDINNYNFMCLLCNLYGQQNISVLENSGLFYKIGIKVTKGDNITDQITIGSLFGLCDNNQKTYNIE